MQSLSMDDTNFDGRIESHWLDIYIKVMSKSRSWIFIGCEMTQLDVISPWWTNETTIKEFHGIWNQNKFHVSFRVFFISISNPFRVSSNIEIHLHSMVKFHGKMDGLPWMPLCRFWVHPFNWWVVLKSTHLLVGFIFNIWMLGCAIDWIMSLYHFFWGCHLLFVSWGFISLWTVKSNSYD